MFKTEITAKTSFTLMKTEKYATADSLELVKKDLEEMNVEKEARNINRNLLINHHQLSLDDDEEDKINILGKRRGDRIDAFAWERAEEG